MALKPLPEPKRDRRIKYRTYDFEWNRGNPKKLRIAGSFDGDRYRVYPTLDEFFEEELTPANHGYRFYAHNSGASDSEFFLEHILTSPNAKSFHVTGVFSGASAIIIEVTKGKHYWTFVDSLWTIRESLKNIGRWLGGGFAKGEVDFDTENVHELTDYNEQDCRILYEAIARFQDVILDLGSELSMTAASTALRLFMRAYLGRDKPGSDPASEIVRPEGIETSPRLNERIRRAYMGGRTEPWSTKRGLEGFVYDVRSAYPAAMQFPVPGNLVGHLEGRRPKSTLAYCGPDGVWRPAEYIADVIVNVPEDIKIPPLPRQAEGSLFFDVGPRRGWYTKPELEYAESVGCEVLKTYECLVFEPMMDLARCSMDLFEKRAKEKKGGFLEQSYKLVGNSLYGKLAERAEKASLLINPDPSEIRKAKTFRPYDKGELRPICPGVWLITKEAKIRHAHVPIASYITARARANLARHMSFTDPWYCDTDSIACADAPRADDRPPWIRDANIEGPEIKLGELGYEKSFTAGFFRGAKFYQMQMSHRDEMKLRQKEETMTGMPYHMTQVDPDTGERFTIPGQACWDFERTAVRAKGFSRIGAGKFRELDLGGTVPIDAMLMKIREMYQAGYIAPRETTRHKRLLDRVRPKRRPESDGSTSAWHVRDFDVPYAETLEAKREALEELRDRMLEAG